MSSFASMRKSNALETICSGGKGSGLPCPLTLALDSPFGTYGQDIEDLIQQGAKWDQLRRE